MHKRTPAHVRMARGSANSSPASLSCRLQKGGATRSKQRAHVAHKCLRALHRAELHAARIAPAPPPGREQLAALLEGSRQAVAEMLALRGVCALRVPLAQGLALLLGCEARAGADAADVRSGVLQVIKARRCDVKVRLVARAAVAVRRAAVLLHDHGGPVWVRGVRVLDEQALAASAHASIIRIPAAAAVIGPHEGRQCIRRRARKPHLLAILGSTKVSGVLGPVTRWGNVLVHVPRLERCRIAALAAAVPVMGHLHAGSVPLAVVATVATVAAVAVARAASAMPTMARRWSRWSRRRARRCALPVAAAPHRCPRRA
mmetsp:Transcript_72852/g.193492  ORF Transcript_72852/g.193492 Transcript_72852/m.193492 type:complete len:317 (-) Transcript_72852:366-1316(-)